ncbi:hypothetical protein [Bacteroides caecimuris]|uniref:Uncharacterized protein n=1 Tax=Bacteroides caecimuris TaxID=1796613 RepID=A0A4S2CS85_9BACE|nr:hypothetical protein [Bacteroides caecimuris]TGY31639.1 hypothetical protein E5353_12890 [Bacteroides caecimuris]
MQAVSFAKPDNTDAKVTGYESANCGNCEGVKGVKKSFFFICSQKIPVKQMVAIREGCEGEELNFIGALVIFGTMNSKPHRFLIK